MRHLTDEELQALSRNDAQTVSHFREHLKIPCAHCEAFLRTAEDTFGLDAAADALLLLGDAEQDDAGYRAVRRKVRGRKYAVLGGAATGLLLSAVLLVLVRSELQDDGLKGGPTLLLEVKVAHQRPDGTLLRLEPDATVPPSGTLLLRYHASENAKARVIKLRADDGAKTVLGEVVLKAGTHDLPTGISLEGESGVTTYTLEADTGRGGQARATVKVRIDDVR